MDVIAFEEGQTLRKDRWVVRLTTAEDGEELFRMNFTAMQTYLLPAVDNGTAVSSANSENEVQRAEDLHVSSQQQSATAQDNGDAMLLELPTTVQWSQEQKKDADLQIWYEWITEQKKPSPENPHFQFWYRDKENVVLDENDVLVRLTRFSTTTRSHVCKQILVPKVYQDRILYLAHGHVTSGHQGVSRTFLKLREQFYWETMKRDINHYILNCPCRGIK